MTNGTYREADALRLILLKSLDGGTTWIPVEDPSAGGGGGSVDVAESGVAVSSPADQIDFLLGFDVVDNAGSAEISLDLSEVSEQVQDIVGALIQNGTGITWTYDDGANTLTGVVSLGSFTTADLTENTNLYFTNERVDDRVAALLQAGANITLTYNDPANTLTIAVSGLASTDLSDFAEAVQDQVGAHVKSGNSLMTVAYDDAGTGDTTLTIDTAVLDERTRDTIGTALTAGANITITVNDPGDTITIAVSSIDVSSIDGGEVIKYLARQYFK
jgi:hypothetical protein